MLINIKHVWIDWVLVQELHIMHFTDRLHIPVFSFFHSLCMARLLIVPYRVHRLKGYVFLTHCLVQDSPLSPLIGENICVFPPAEPAESDCPAPTVSKIPADQSDLLSERIGTKAFTASPPPLDFKHIHTPTLTSIHTHICTLWWALSPG